MLAQKTQSSRSKPAAGDFISQEIAGAKPPAGRLADVPLDRIDSHPDNPRQNWELDGLAASIDQVGVVQPIVVRPKAKGRFELVAGERRVRAARRAGDATIPSIIRELSDAAALEIMLLENLHRRDFEPLEKARLLVKLTTPAADGGAGRTVQDVADLLDKSRPWVSNSIRLLKLPEAWQRKLAAGEINEHQARTAAGYVDRPGVLDQASVDMTANPVAYRPTADFEKRLSHIAHNVSTSPPAKPRTSCAPRAAAARAPRAIANSDTQRPPLIATEDLAGDIEPPATSFPDAEIVRLVTHGRDCDAACALVVRLNSLHLVARVQESLDAQRKRLTRDDD
jgi:ParB family chromosome partitioning protein